MPVHGAFPIMFSKGTPRSCLDGCWVWTAFRSHPGAPLLLGCWAFGSLYRRVRVCMVVILLICCVACSCLAASAPRPACHFHRSRFGVRRWCCASLHVPRSPPHVTAPIVPWSVTSATCMRKRALCQLVLADSDERYVSLPPLRVFCRRWTGLTCRSRAPSGMT